MFGYVTVNADDLAEDEKRRYTSVYCGICREIGRRCGTLPRVVLSYDTAFLALLLMSLYEPEEQQGENGCLTHPFRKSPWTNNAYIAYAADMNVALAYHNCVDDWKDDRSLSKKMLADMLRPHYERIQSAYPRQCGAMEACMDALSQMEAAAEPNPDLPAGVFGSLMAELFVVQEDLWSETLRQMGRYLGRFIYLMDAAADCDRDEKKGKYNPFLACGMGRQEARWKEYLVLTMGSCTTQYEKLPLVQDKALLDVILYSGVWVNYQKGREEKYDGQSL